MLYGYAIIIKRNGEDGSKYPLTSREIKIGTAPGCQILINTPFVSHEHCALIVKDDEQVCVKNLSEKSTIINDCALLGEIALNHGDVLDIGGRLLRWEYLPSSRYAPTNLQKQTPAKERQMTPKARKSSSSMFSTPKSVNKVNSATKMRTPQSGTRISKIMGRKSLQAAKLLFSPVNKSRRKSDAIRKLQSNDLLQIVTVTNANTFKSVGSPLARQDTPLKRMSLPGRASKGGLANSKSAKLGSIQEFYSSPVSAKGDFVPNISMNYEMETAELERSVPGGGYSTPPEVKTPLSSPRSARSATLSPVKIKDSAADATISTPPEVVTPAASPAPTPSKRRIQQISPKRPPNKSGSTAKVMASPKVTPMKSPRGKGSARKKTPAKSAGSQKSPKSLASGGKIAKQRITPVKVKSPATSPAKVAKETPVKASPRRKTPAKSPSPPKAQGNSAISSPRKSPSKSFPAKSSVGLKTPAKSPAGRKMPAKSPVGRKTPTKSPVGQKTPAKSPVGRKTPTKSPVGRKTPAKSPVGLKTPAKSPVGRKTPAKSPVGRKTPGSKQRKTPVKSPKVLQPVQSNNEIVPLEITVPTSSGGVSVEPLKGQIQQKLANILSNTNQRAKNKEVILKRKLVKKAIQVSTKKPRMQALKRQAVLPANGRRVSKRNKVEPARPEYTELSPSALGLTPRVSPTTPTTILKSPQSKSAASKRSVSFVTGTRDLSVSFRTPDISQDVFVSPLTTSVHTESTSPKGSKRAKSAIINKIHGKVTVASPYNDFSKFAGVGKLLRTPRLQKSPQNDLRDIPDLKDLLKTPAASKDRKSQVPKSPTNDLTDVRGVKEIFASSPKNDLRQVVSIRRLVKSPANAKAKTVAKAQRKPGKSPKNDLTDVAGVKNLFSSPKVQRSPRNDLSEIPSIRVLMKTPPQKKTHIKKTTPKQAMSPRNDLTNVNGLRYIFVSPKESVSPVLTGVKDIFRTPKQSPKSSPIPKRVTRLAAGTPVGRARAAAATPSAATPPPRATRARKVTAPTEESAPEVPTKVKKLATAEDAESAAGRRTKATAAKTETPAKTRGRRKIASPVSSPPKANQSRRDRTVDSSSDTSLTEKKTTRRGRAGKAQSPKQAAVAPVEETKKGEASKPRGRRAANKQQQNEEVEVVSSPPPVSPKKRTRSAVTKAASPAKKGRTTRNAAAKKSSPSPKRTRSRTAATKK